MHESNVAFVISVTISEPDPLEEALSVCKVSQKCQIVHELQVAFCSIGNYVYLIILRRLIACVTTALGACKGKDHLNDGK